MAVIGPTSQVHTNPLDGGVWVDVAWDGIGDFPPEFRTGYQCGRFGNFHLVLQDVRTLQTIRDDLDKTSLCPRSPSRLTMLLSLRYHAAGRRPLFFPCYHACTRWTLSDGRAGCLLFAQQNLFFYVASQKNPLTSWSLTFFTPPHPHRPQCPTMSEASCLCGSWTPPSTLRDPRRSGALACTRLKLWTVSVPRTACFTPPR